MVVSSSPVTLRKKIRCVNCWGPFAPDDVVWVSESREHFGDRLLGSEAPSRFQALRFSVEGDGVDAYGARCPQIACPNCHLAIPRDLLSMRPLTVSILGSPSCGKSFFLASMVWKLRRLLPQAFQVDFTDSDHYSNLALSSYEQAIFLAPHPDKLAPLDQLIPKTELQGQLYNSVLQRGNSVLLPKPFSFRLGPAREHAANDQAGSLSRFVCMYDNAGEHFLPGADTAKAPGTRHLAVSDLLVFLYDPLQDVRFVRSLGSKRLEKLVQRYTRPVQQEQILREAADRIKRHASHTANRKKPARLVVVVTKFDEWAEFTDPMDNTPPYALAENGVQRLLNIKQVQANSKRLRAVLRKTLPELVHAAETVSEDPIFVPSSALGAKPTMQDGVAMLKPSAISPVNVEVPFLIGAAEHCPALVPGFTG